ncbi:MAG: metallophosphoesterase family protein [Anaerolineae bacterium]|nr:metallophosphoesterase family protein [Gemmatimonadaceae bacterium]
MPKEIDSPIHLIGLISDTHGLLRPEVFAALDGVHVIFHAGDVGGDDILDALGEIAPTFAVFGNTDPPDDHRLAGAIERQFGGLRIHVSHGHELGVPTPEKLLAAYSAEVLIYGHTHKQLVVRAGGRTVINPGAAGQRRFKLSPSVAKLAIRDRSVDAQVIPLGGE